ncbi:FAD-dependent oxidoreductase [Methylobacterium sp. J-068]|uniref:FAD-dependent oxidoreductase n=1 Tax=Methylobacterium sp. J-068 TaxID=2836649 RepID=UPI001FB929A0|nr:NAD(P)/FAD-dependent oxidoreductase [Methylobacterium sp. J-068]MCJ2036641.1 FAD-dependent monooxygenase [Methylobacterium sp. J-068]
MIIGAGLAGSVAASTLAQSGADVVLIDAAAIVPPSLRAEKLGTDILALFDRLGLGETVRAAATPISSVWIARFGRVMKRRSRLEYAFAYKDLVTALRANLPAKVDLRFGRVADIESGPDLQRVTLNDGSVVEARLLIVATGPSAAIHRRVGIDIVDATRDHSVCIGFYLKEPPRAYPFESIVYYGEHWNDRVSYISLFPIGTRMRANLFVYRTHDEPWMRDFRRAPAETLRQTLPNLEKVCGPIEIEGNVDVRPIDLRLTEGHERAGVVLIGDAYCTSCPVSGTGMHKALIDVERLCREHVPAWLATPGMGPEKISAFYADRIKADFDRNSLALSNRLRGLATGRGVRWTLARAAADARSAAAFTVHRGAQMAAVLITPIAEFLERI